MVRRRSASPRASGPVRSTPMRSALPARTTTTPATVPRQAPAGAAAAQPRQPGLLGQMAATAGGVAIGSAVGHAVGNMFSGGAHDQPEAAPTMYEPQQKPYSSPCEFEYRQFLECAERQPDVGYCQSFNDLFKECKARAGQ